MLSALPSRVAYVLARYGPRVAVVLLLAGAAALGSAGWVAANPPTTEVTDRTNRVTVESTVTASALVTGNTSLYEEGTRLTDQPVYLDAATPRPRLTLRTALPGDRPVTVVHRVAVVYRATRNGETFWSNRTVLADETTTTSGDAATTRTHLSIPAVRSRLRAVRAEVGDAGSVEAVVRATVEYDLPAYDGTFEETVGLGLSRQSYTLDGASASRAHGTPETRVVTVPGRNPWPHRLLGGAGVAALLAGVAVGVRHYREGGDADRLAHEVHRERYAEWISRGSVPAGLGDRAVQIESLEALVDVAIDTGNRVIADAERGHYAVIDGPTVYYFDPFWAAPDGGD